MCHDQLPTAAGRKPYQFSFDNIIIAQSVVG